MISARTDDLLARQAVVIAVGPRAVAASQGRARGVRASAGVKAAVKETLTPGARHSSSRALVATRSREIRACGGRRGRRRGRWRARFDIRRRTGGKWRGRARRRWRRVGLVLARRAASVVPVHVVVCDGRALLSVVALLRERVCVLIVKVPVAAEPAAGVILVDQAVVIVVDAVIAELGRKMCVDVGQERGLAVLVRTTHDAALPRDIAQHTVDASPIDGAGPVAMPAAVAHLRSSGRVGDCIHVGRRSHHVVVLLKVSKAGGQPRIVIRQSRLAESDQRASL